MKKLYAKRECEGLGRNRTIDQIHSINKHEIKQENELKWTKKEKRASNKQFYHTAILINISNHKQNKIITEDIQKW